MNQNSLANLSRFLLENDDYAIACHENPDGDALGSLLALLLALRSAGKRVQGVCVDPVPYKYRNLFGKDELRTPEELTPFLHLILVDCADADRAKIPKSALENVRAVANIDHHTSNTGFGDYPLVSSTAAATGVLIYDLIVAMGIPVTTQMATNLFVAISADTGHFSQANTDARSLHVAANLVALGARADKIAQDMFQTRTACWTKLLGHAIASLQMHCDGKVAVMFVSLSDLCGCSAAPADTEGLIDFARNIEGIDVAALIRQTEGGLVKVSLRSKDAVDVSEVAKHFAGGGHRRAAGYTQTATPEEAMDTLIGLLSPLCDGSGQ
jgi:phosphoesterase RecJ-like protein